MLELEAILGLVAAALTILGFMAKAYANIRCGRRVKRDSRSPQPSTPGRA